MVIPGARATVATWGNLNKYIVTAHEDGTVLKWDPVTGQKLETIQAHQGAITDLQMSNDKSFFVTSSKDQSAKLFDAETFQEMKVYKSDRPLNSAAISPNREHIVMGGGQEARDVTTTSARQGKLLKENN